MTPEKFNKFAVYSVYSLKHKTEHKLKAWQHVIIFGTFSLFFPLKNNIGIFVPRYLMIITIEHCAMSYKAVQNFERDQFILSK